MKIVKKIRIIKGLSIALNNDDMKKNEIVISNDEMEKLKKGI